MQEISFLGFSKSEWDFINSFANWASAIGSIAAAWVALHLANRIARPTAKVRVGHRIVFGTDDDPPYPEYVMFSIVNSGDRNFRVTHISWRVGIFRKRFALQIHDRTISSPLPVELNHGQEAQWLVPMAYSTKTWVEHFAHGFIMEGKSGWLASAGAFFALLSLRAVFTTSLGHEFITRPESNIIERLRSACRKSAPVEPRSSEIERDD